MSTFVPISTGRIGGAAIVLIAAALLGSLDLIFAGTYWNVLYGAPPTRTLQGIAAGLLGPRAFADGVTTIWLGALLHYTIMIVMVGTFYLASRYLPALTRWPWLSGALYGLALYIVMNAVVLPLSAAPKLPFLPSWIVASIVVHVLVIGVPIAWAARWASDRG